MKKKGKCPKCSGKEIESLTFLPSAALEFPTYYLGDIVVPKLYICTACGYAETWVDNDKDLDDIRKFFKSRKDTNKPANK